MPVLSHWLETGLDLVTHYSGHGTPEWSMDFIVKAARSKGVRANVFATHSSDMNERCRAVLAHDCPHSLVQSAHVFGALEEHFLPRSMQELQKLQRVVAESGNGVAAAAAVINMARYLRAHRQAGTLLGTNTRARCHKCHKDCPVFVDPQSRPVLVAAGTTCVDYSSVGARQGIFGKSISAFLLWVSDILYRKPTFIVHECTELWRVSILVYFLEDECNMCLSHIISPTLFGWPCRRPRRYSFFTLKSAGIHWQGSAQDFIEKMGCKVELQGDIFWDLPAECVEAEKKAWCKRRNRALDPTLGFQDLATDLQRQRFPSKHWRFVAVTFFV